MLKSHHQAKQHQTATSSFSATTKVLPHTNESPSHQHLQSLVNPSPLMALPAINGIKLSQVYNDSSIDHQIELMQLKSIISKELPKMPREYIVKVLMDGIHQSIIAKDEDGCIIGGICFRGFEKKGFIQVVFMVVQACFKGRGIGTKIINFLKGTYCMNEDTSKKQKIGLILTYADNTAVDFFRKMGFQAVFETPQKQWSGYIKAYLEGTLMQCRVYGELQYEGFKQMVIRHKRVLKSKIKERNIDFRYKSSCIQSSRRKYFTNTEQIQPIIIRKVTIPGLHQARWSALKELELQKNRQYSYILEQLSTISSLRKLLPSLTAPRVSNKCAQMHKETVSVLPLMSWSMLEKMTMNRWFDDGDDLRLRVEEMVNGDMSGAVDGQSGLQLRQKVDGILKVLMLRQIIVRVEVLFKEKWFRNSLSSDKANKH